MRPAERGENYGANPSLGPPLSTGIENAMVEPRIADFLIPAIIRYPLVAPTSKSPSEAEREEIQPSGQVARSAGIVGLAVMVSRIFGLVREQVFAAFFGASMVYDAFLMAFRIPNLLRDLFAEGALSAAFVTTFSQHVAQKGEAAAWRLANLVLNALILILLPLTILGMIFSP